MPNSELIDQIAKGLAQGEYSLLLGAGASIGAVGGNNRPLPTGTGLRNALIEEFDIDTDGETLSLSQIYSYLQLNQRKETNIFLREWFSKCQPSWQDLFTKFSWKRIWTLNIDDVIEASFKNVNRPLESLSWNERFSERSFASDQQIIHLHGLAERITNEGQNEGVLVFSLSEYAHEVANPRTWHKVFHDEFASKPFVVIGAQLTEEIDLIEALERGSTARVSTGFPSVVVVPRISQIWRTQMEAYGFVIVESNAESFVIQLLDRYEKIISEFADVRGGSTPGLMKFQQQYIDLRRFTPHNINAEDFYSGYQPTWNTILSGDDAVLDKTNQISSEIANMLVNEQAYQKIVFLTGNPGSGKSTALLRIASNLIGKGARPFLFRADEYMDVEATIEWLKTVPYTVLLFDDFADHSITLQRLAERCHEEKVKMLLIASDRPARHTMISNLIAERYLNLSEAHWYGRLSDPDIDRTIGKLYDRGRLGYITRWNRQQQRHYFADLAGRSLFDAMADLESGRGFRERVRNVYQTLPTDGLKNLYAAACLCYEQSIPIPTSIGAGFAGVSPKDLAKLIENQCRGILVLTRTGIRPPHRITATLVLHTLPSKVRAEISLELAKALAPHIDERAMRSGTREYRIIRHLMRHETVSRNAGEHGGRVWYDNLRQYYDWNGRYWDQRALFESERGEHETARSYAERSIQVHPHSFGYNTLGTVLLRTAIRHGSVDALSEGIKNLNASKSFHDWGEREHPYTTFFTSLIRYAQEWGFAEVPQQARNAWAEWFNEAQSSPVFSTVKGHGQLNNWQRQWLGLASS